MLSNLSIVTWRCRVGHKLVNASGEACEVSGRRSDTGAEKSGERIVRAAAFDLAEGAIVESQLLTHARHRGLLPRVPTEIQTGVDSAAGACSDMEKRNAHNVVKRGSRDHP